MPLTVIAEIRSRSRIVRFVALCTISGVVATGSGFDRRRAIIVIAVIVTRRVVPRTAIIAVARGEGAADYGAGNGARDETAAAAMTIITATISATINPGATAAKSRTGTAAKSRTDRATAELGDAASPARADGSDATTATTKAAGATATTGADTADAGRRLGETLNWQDHRHNKRDGCRSTQNLQTGHYRLQYTGCGLTPSGDARSRARARIVRMSQPVRSELYAE